MLYFSRRGMWFIRKVFKIIDVTNETEDRKGKIVDWVMIMAQKV